MKGKLFKKALAVATSVLMLSGGVPIKPVADLFGSTSITAYAQGSNVDLSTLTGSYTAQDGEILSGTTSQTITIADDASITLNGVTITGGIVCAGTAEITLVGTNSVTGFSRYDSNINAYRYTAGIQIGGSGTTLTINGDGSLTANGAQYAAGIGLNGAWNVTEDVIGGNIVINGGNITANGGVGAAGIGAGFTKDQNNSSERKAIVGNITIKGGTVTAVGVTAVGGNGADGIGAGDNIYNATYQIGTVTIYDDIDKVDASSIKNFASVVYKQGETDVTANKADYFTIIEDGDRRVIAPKDDNDYTITIANGIEHGTLTGAATAKYMEKVTITATPTLGYRFSRLVVKDAQNKDVESTGNSFFMPKSNVTVSAVFEQGTHGTTEFAWGYQGNHDQGFVKEATIYDGVTTVNIQETGQNEHTGTSYRIRKYEGNTNYNFRLDNNENGQAIPFTGTGEFLYNINPTAFYVTDNNELGFYDITMTDVGNGKWSVSILKTVAVMDAVPDQAYTGSAITPEPTVIAGSLNLTKGTDYTYSYENNTNAGTATVRATFQGDYESLGYVERTFTILPSSPVVVNVTGNGTVTYNDKSAASGETIGVTAEKGTDVTLTLTPENGYAVSIEYGYTNSKETTISGIKLPINGTTATLTVPNDLKDGTYVSLTVTFVSALAGGADEASAVALTDNTVTDLAGGWYKVGSDITFDHTLNLLGDTHLIIDDGKTMTVNTASGKAIDSEYTLNVSGEGALNITTTEAYKTAVRVGSYVQTGATVTASGYIGIRCTDDFIAFNFDNDFTFSGGQLTATGSGGNGIWADNDITLSCTNATDYIQASSYSSAYGAVKIAEGNALTDGTSTYTGILTGDDLKAISEQTLVAAEVENTRNIVNAANITLGGELGLNFYVTVPGDVVTAGAKVVMDGPEGEKEVVLSSLTKDDNGRYKVTYKLKAIFVDRKVSLKVVGADDTVLDLYKTSGDAVDNGILEYGIYDYVELSKTCANLTDADKKTIKAMYTYGAYSVQWKYGTPLPDDVDALPEITKEQFEKYALKQSGTNSSITLTGASLVLDSNTAFRLYFTVSDDIANHSIKLGENVLTPHETETVGKYYVDIENIGAGNLKTDYTVSFDGSYTVTVSAMTYVYNYLKSGMNDEKLCNLLKALYAYSEAVNPSNES